MGKGCQNMKYCSACKQKESVARTADQNALCKKCFVDYVENQVLDTIKEFSMIRSGEKIVVALSGGKDSICLLHILAQLKDNIHFDLFALSIDEGIGEYRRESLEVASYNTSLLNVPHTIIRFAEMFQGTIENLSNKSKLSPCGVCGPLRRRALNIGARDLEADKIATGHNMDDELQTYLMNILDGRSSIPRPYQSGVNAMIIPRIKPLWGTSQKEIVLYNHLTAKIAYMDKNCPYAELSVRPSVTGFLNQIENRKPDSKKKLWSYIQRIPVAEQGHKKTRCCSVCGEISSSKICNVCKIVDALRRP
jgi:uncharacterized protein (TIGR00269 family)